MKPMEAGQPGEDQQRVGSVWPGVTRRLLSREASLSLAGMVAP